MSYKHLALLKRSCSPVRLLGALLAGLSLASCASYKQNIMFRVPDGQAVKTQVEAAAKNYTIQQNDALQLGVYTNKGERLIDPAAALSGEQVATTDTPRTYLVNTEGKVRFPLIDEVSLEGLTIRQAETILQEAYAKFYQEPYVTLTYTNKRVTVLGAPGGQVIPLANENVRLTEILALAKGLSNDAKASNIRVLRGDQVFVADFSTFEGYTRHNMIVAPGDVIYVEPIRRPFSEGLRDYGPLISIITSLTTLIVVIVGL